MWLIVGLCQCPSQSFSGKKAPVSFSSLTENSTIKPRAMHHETDFSHLFGKGKNHQGTIWVSEAASGVVGTADSPPN